MEWKETYHEGKYEYRRFEQSIWLKVFFHDMSTFVGFYNEEEVLSCNSATKYSILTELNSSLRQRNGNFEFLLEYPELGVVNWWQQKNSPLDETETGHAYTEGYKKIFIEAPHSKWGGLAKSSSSTKHCTLINGTPSDISAGSWHFAIGMFNGVTWDYNNLPSNGVPTNIVYLWVKVPGKTFRTKVRCINHRHNIFPIAILLIID